MNLVPVGLGCNEYMCRWAHGTHWRIQGAEPQPKHARHTVSRAGDWRPTIGTERAMDALGRAERLERISTAYDLKRSFIYGDVGRKRRATGFAATGTMAECRTAKITVYLILDGTT